MDDPPTIGAAEIIALQFDGTTLLKTRTRARVGIPIATLSV
jgi:hypothetical protein